MSTLSGRAGVAIRMALQNDERGERALESYVAELGDGDLAALDEAADALHAATGVEIERRNP